MTHNEAHTLLDWTGVLRVEQAVTEHGVQSALAYYLAKICDDGRLALRNPRDSAVLYLDLNAETVSELGRTSEQAIDARRKTLQRQINRAQAQMKSLDGDMVVYL